MKTILTAILIGFAIAHLADVFRLKGMERTIFIILATLLIWGIIWSI